MGMKQKLDEKIRRKKQEIQDLEGKIREASAYIQALEEAAKLLPRETARQVSVEMALRPGSGAYKAYSALQKAGKPLHVTEIMKAIDMPINKKNRIALGGTLSRYSRNEEFFLKTAPNTFTILDSAIAAEPPDDFGSIADDEPDYEVGDEEEAEV